MHQILVSIHVWSSILFSVIAVILLLYTLKGLLTKSEFTKKHIYLENSFISLLYLGLVLGIVLYFFIDQDESMGQLSIEQAQEVMSSRFWAIEHFSVMLFALMLAQIGKIFTLRAINSKNKFKYALFYYGLATTITFISTGFYLYYKA